MRSGATGSPFARIFGWPPRILAYWSKLEYIATVDYIRAHWC